MNYEEILLTKQGTIATLTLNKPDKINALSIKMVDEIDEVFTRLSTDETVKVIVIKATGKHFCAGHLLSEMVDQDMRSYKALFDQ